MNSDLSPIEGLSVSLGARLGTRPTLRFNVQDAIWCAALDRDDVMPPLGGTALLTNLIALALQEAADSIYHVGFD